MQTARILGMGIMLLATSAAAQESSIDAAKSAAASSASDPQAALAYGRALRRAGKYDAATAELRRGVAIARAADALAILHWEIARVLIDKRDFSQAMVACKVVGAQTGQGAGNGEHERGTKVVPGRGPLCGGYRERPAKGAVWYELKDDLCRPIA